MPHVLPAHVEGAQGGTSVGGDEPVEDRGRVKGPPFEVAEVGWRCEMGRQYGGPGTESGLEVGDNKRFKKREGRNEVDKVGQVLEHGDMELQAGDGSEVADEHGSGNVVCGVEGGEGQRGDHLKLEASADDAWEGPIPGQGSEETELADEGDHDRFRAQEVVDVLLHERTGAGEEVAAGGVGPCSADGAAGG